MNPHSAWHSLLAEETVVSKTLRRDLNLNGYGPLRVIILGAVSGVHCLMSCHTVLQIPHPMFSIYNLTTRRTNRRDQTLTTRRDEVNLWACSREGQAVSREGHTESWCVNWNLNIRNWTSRAA